jgi:hypothetical protein
MGIVLIVEVVIVLGPWVFNAIAGDVGRILHEALGDGLFGLRVPRRVGSSEGRVGVLVVGTALRHLSLRTIPVWDKGRL